MTKSNKNFGWVKLYRSLRNNWMWEEKPFTAAQAWIDILMRASYEDCDFGLGGEIISIKSGTFVTSLHKLAEAWGWDRAKVRRYLKRLESELRITLNVNAKRTTISVMNWAFYQDERTDMIHNSNPNHNTDDPEVNLIKKNKNTNKKNENPLDHPADDRPVEDPLFEQFWRAYPKKQGKGAALKAWKKIRPSKSLVEKMLVSVEAAKGCEQWQKQNGQFIPYPATWLNQGRWDDEVPAADVQLTPNEIGYIEQYMKMGYTREEMIEKVLMEREEDAKRHNAVFS